MRLNLAAGAAVVACAQLSLPAMAETPAEFYKDRTIEVLVGTGPGGGYDDYTRLLTRFMGKHIPGGPSFVVKNLASGGGRAAINQIYSVMPKDGSGFGTTIKAVPFDPLYGIDAVKIDATQMGWLGSLNSEVPLCVVWAGKGITSIDDARNKEVLMGSNGPSITDSILPRLLNKIAGTKFKVVLGYKSSTEVHIAMERGEVDGRCGLGYDSLVSRYSHWLKDKKVHILAQFGLSAKHPDLKDVPWVMDLTKAKEDKQIAELLLGPNEMGRPYMAPPGVPADRLAVLRQAFVASAKDPELLAQAAKQDIAISLMTGEQVAALVERIYQTPPEVVALTKKIVDPD
jgi:tripartite-type tricarboxylate transporter receptor subunit TctC